MTYAVLVTASAKRDLDRIHPRVTPAIIEFLYGPLAEAPRRVGKPMREDLEGLYGARRGEFRLPYRIDEESANVTVVRIGHRSQVYRPS